MQDCKSNNFCYHINLTTRIVKPKLNIDVIILKN